MTFLFMSGKQYNLACLKLQFTFSTHKSKDEHANVDYNCVRVEMSFSRWDIGNDIRTLSCGKAKQCQKVAEVERVILGVPRNE